MSSTAILVVDDEPAIQRSMSTLLRSRGYVTTVAATGAEALKAFDSDRPNIVILDLGLPDLDGIEVCRRLRARSEVPIVVLSVRGDERSKVAALDAGADDYVTKPFSTEELLARVRAGIRRSAGAPNELRGRLVRGGLVLDFDQRRVYRDEVDIRLTPKEFELLTLLASHGGVLTHRSLVKALWGSVIGGQEHLRVLVGQLRKKLELDPANPRYVLTEPWVGYRFEEDTGE